MLTNVVEIAVVDNSSILATLGLSPTRGVQSALDEEFLVLIDLESGLVRGRLLKDATAALRALNRLRRKSACIGRDGDKTYVAAMNDWAFEGVLFDFDTLNPLVHFVTAFDLPHHEDEFGSWVPGGAFSTVLCGRDAILFKGIKYQYHPDRRPTVATVMIEARSYSGELLARLKEDGEHTELKGRGVATVGNRFLFTGADQSGFPRLVEFELVPGEQWSDPLSNKGTVQ
jgi:hypothetical protein